MSVSVLAALLTSAPAFAGVIGSKHDFSSRSFGQNGACTACHLAHNAVVYPGKSQPLVLWGRNMNAEDSEFSQQDAPNYLPSMSVLCYDCHVDANNGIGATPDNDPSDWNLLPQDIAWSDGPGHNAATDFVGYYELYDGSKPSAGSPPTDGSKTGGHYWKDEPTGTPDYAQGDKIPCSFCHDPHDSKTGGNEAMILEETPNGAGGTVTIGTNLDASPHSRNGTGTGREICTACHSYSNAGSPVTMWGVSLPKPPDMTEHRNDDPASTPCTDCHRHNYVTASCTDCHGYPPPPEDSYIGTYNGIDETMGPHPRHANLSDAEVADGGPGYAFVCEECHTGYKAEHKDGTYQSVVFETAEKNPNGYYEPLSPPRTCNNLYCHSRGTFINDTENAAGTTTVQWTGDAGNDWSVNDLNCNACHGDPAVTSGDVEYGAPAYANKTIDVGGGVLKANSHARHRYACSFCHYSVIQDSNHTDGWTLFDITQHVDNTNSTFHFDVVSDPTGRFDSYTYAPSGGTCTNVDCHQGQSPTWGDETIRPTCQNCHGTAGGNDRDDWNISDNQHSMIRLPEWTASGHGRSGTWYPWPANDGKTTPANLGCVSSSPNTPTGGCHITQVLHQVPENPFRLATKDTSGNYHFEYDSEDDIDDDSVNLFCQTATCHSGVMDQPHSEAVTEGWGAGSNWPAAPADRNAFKCTDCHDPHGDSPDYMIHARVFADSSTVYGLPNTASLGEEPDSGAILFDVSSPEVNSDYVSTTGGANNKICQVCHLNNEVFTRSSTDAGHQGGGECMVCHAHADGFKPSGCEGCHGLGGSVHPGKEGWGDPAPDVMTYWNGDWWDSNEGGTDSIQQGGHGDPDGDEGGDPALAPMCQDCHSISGEATHFDGTYDSIWDNGSRNANTVHLVPDYFDAARSEPPDRPNGSGTWNVQVLFDNYCAQKCHPAVPVTDMRHEKDTAPSDADHWSLKFGTHLTRPNPDSPNIAYPVDCDLNTNADCGPDYYAPCISCHDPHGTPTPSKGNPGSTSNFMVRDDFQNKTNDLCRVCHI